MYKITDKYKLKINNFYGIVLVLRKLFIVKHGSHCIVIKQSNYIHNFALILMFTNYILKKT